MTYKTEVLSRASVQMAWLLCSHCGSITCHLQAVLQAGSYEELVKYLLMVRKKHKDSKVDTELVYAYGKTKQLGPLEEFISSPHQANLQVSQADSWSFLAWMQAGQCACAAGRWCEEELASCSDPHLG